MDLWTATPDQFIDAFREHGLRRAYVVSDPHTMELRASHPLLNPFVDALLADSRDFRHHEACFFERGHESGHLLTAFIHRTRRGQAVGGVRFWDYETMEGLVRDGLRLSRGMGQKCALAGLWWGGGQGVIARRLPEAKLDQAARAAVFEDYGRFISGLSGCYVTAVDVGTTTEDMALIFSQTRHATCIPRARGGSGNPSVFSAAGVTVAMEAALDFLGLGSLEGKVVAMQGLGSVSTCMIDDLLKHGVKRIVGADIDEAAVRRIERRFEGAPIEVRTVVPGDTSILAEPCDILAPNGIGAILNPKTISEIRARIVCGSANNQLEENDRDSAALQQREILYVPDFLANRMGTVNCANEPFGTLEDDPAILVHLGRKSPTGIFQRCQEVFDRARASGRTTAFEAAVLAQELELQLHPIWGHRGQVIIDHLVDCGWDRDDCE